MDRLTDMMVGQVLQSLDPTPVNPTRAQRFLAFTVCKNLKDLGETGSAILNSLQQRGCSLRNLPDQNSIRLCQNILKKFYSDDMFIEDEEFGNRPNWKAVQNFPKSSSDTSYRIYRAIRNNAVGKPGSKLIQKAVENRDKKYFIANFDSIFEDVPFKDGLTAFKNFLATDDVCQDDQDYVWEFFESLLDIFIYEADNLEDLENM